VRALAERSLTHCFMPSGLGRLVGLRGWLVVKAGSACLSLSFAPYFQHRVWQELVKDAQPTDTVPKLTRLSKAQVQASITKVFMHDLSVCFYFFASVGSTVWGYLGLRWTALGRDCSCGGYPLRACWLGFLGFLVALQYSVFSLRRDCSTCGEDDGSEWGRCEPRPPSPKRQHAARKPDKPVPSRRWMEPPCAVLMNSWDLGSSVGEEPVV